MKSGDLAVFLSETLQIKTNTVLDYAKDLRGSKPRLLSKGTRGRYAGAEMTSADAVNWLLALSLTHAYGEGIAANVRRARALPLDKETQASADFAKRLSSFAADTAGRALDSLIEDIRSGRLSAWAAGETPRLSVQVESGGRRVMIALSDIDFKRNAIHSFAPAGRDESVPRLVERNVVIDGQLFFQLAEKLGPPG